MDGCKSRRGKGKRADECAEEQTVSTEDCSFYQNINDLGIGLKCPASVCQ